MMTSPTAKTREEVCLERDIKIQSRNATSDSFNYRALFEASADPMLLLRNSDDEVLAANEAFKKGLGWNADVDSVCLADVLAADSIVRLKEQQRLADDKQNPPVDLTAIHQDGTRLDVKASCLPDAETTCLILRVTSQPASQLQELEAILNAFPDVLIVLDRDGVYRHIFASDGRQLVEHPSKMIGKRIEDVLKPEEAAIGMETIRRILRTGQPSRLEYPLMIDEQEIWYSANVVPFELEGETCAMWVCRDISDLVEAREARKRYQELLRGMLKVQEQQLNLIASEIHDGLVQDIAGVQMWLEALVADDPLVAEMQDALRRAVAEGRQLINGLRPYVTEETNLSGAVWNLVTDFQQKSEFEIDLQQDDEFEGVLPLVRKSVIRVIGEALNNAHRHSDAKKVAVRLRQTDGELRLRIDDDGRGFDPNRVSPSRFGLESIRHRAQVFGGSATITSKPQGGTKIQVTIPANDARDA